MRKIFKGNFLLLIQWRWFVYSLLMQAKEEVIQRDELERTCEAICCIGTRNINCPILEPMACSIRSFGERVI